MAAGGIEDDGCIASPSTTSARRIFTNPSMPGVGPEDQRALIRAAIATMERLHSLNPAEVGLGTFGRPEG